MMSAFDMPSVFPSNPEEFLGDIVKNSEDHYNNGTTHSADNKVRLPEDEEKENRANRKHLWSWQGAAEPTGLSDARPRSSDAENSSPGPRMLQYPGDAECNTAADGHDSSGIVMPPQQSGTDGGYGEMTQVPPIWNCTDSIWRSYNPELMSFIPEAYVVDDSVYWWDDGIDAGTSKQYMYHQWNHQGSKYRRNAKQRWTPSWPTRAVCKRFASLLMHYLDPFTIQHNRYLRKNETVPFFSIDFLSGLSRFRRTYERFPLETQVDLFKFACEHSDGCLRFVAPDCIELTTKIELRTFTKIPGASQDVVDFIDAKTEDQQQRPVDHFSVMSYCVSSDLSQASHFPKGTDDKQHESLSWRPRRGLLRRQFAAYGPEIVTLQGVQSMNVAWVSEPGFGEPQGQECELDHLGYLLSTLRHYGCAYSPVIRCPRTSQWSFGCAILWNKDVFQLSSVSVSPSGVIVDLLLIETGKKIRVVSTKPVSSYKMDWGSGATKDDLTKLQAEIVDINEGNKGEKDDNVIWCGEFGACADDEIDMTNSISEICGGMEWTCFSTDRPSSDRIFHHGLQAVACLGGHSDNFFHSMDTDEVLNFFPSDHLPQVAVFRALCP
eukprot:GEMP01023280.1.p1 GENE.GEMP01023280.1~~GEMP01023280.1.p1  ORF type:complete len:605 (+),score=125.14 GEMP01023280.1:216-2030(+)